MTALQRIIKNTGLLLFSDIITKILGFFYIMYIARYLGAEGFGVLSFALAFTGIFSMFIDLGMHQLIIREVARDRSLARKYLANVALLETITTFGATKILLPSSTSPMIFTS